MGKIRFDTVSAEGKQQPFTGVFQSEAEANKWYQKHSDFWRQRGRELIRVKVKYYEPED